MRPGLDPRSVKHLNPRQGITTTYSTGYGGLQPYRQCETPKSPPGDYNQVNPRIDRRNVARPCETPKSPPGDYNRRIRRSRNCPRRLRVKHLNPRQGITTSGIAVPDRRGPVQACETPKSPPGDYNYSSTSRNAASMIRKCETPKSPPGDYNAASRTRRR